MVLKVNNLSGEEKRAEFTEPFLLGLFRLEPSGTAPATGEKEWLCELEERALTFKKLQAQEEAADKAQLLAIREALLPDLQAAGLFSEAYCEEKRLWLEKWECATLLIYHKQAMKFMTHLRQQLAMPSAEGLLSVSIFTRQLSLPYQTNKVPPHQTANKATRLS
ncbi:MAG: hypothetical protein ACPGWR_21655 [Ardenticatenaceae bacterium]